MAVGVFGLDHEISKEVGHYLVLVPGWTVADGESRDKWRSADDDTAAKRLQDSFGLADDQVWAKKIVTPAQARKAVITKLREQTKGLKVKDAEIERVVETSRVPCAIRT